MRAAIAALAVLATTAAPASGQERQPYGYFGIAADAARAAGEFGEQVDGALGFNAHYIHRLDPTGTLGMRAGFGAAIYGHESRPVRLSDAVGDRILVDLVTTNAIYYLEAAPQLVVPGDAIRPYANAAVGASYFSTDSNLRGQRGQNFAGTTNYDDWALSYGGGVGVYIPLTSGRQPAALDLGLRYRHTGEVTYLREDSIEDRADGSIVIHPLTSDTDLYTLQLGVSIGLRRDRDRGRWRD